MAIARLLRATLLTGWLAVNAAIPSAAAGALSYPDSAHRSEGLLLAQVPSRPGSAAGATGSDPLRDQQTRQLQQRAAEQREAANQRLRALREQQAAADRAQRRCDALQAQAAHLAAHSRQPPVDAMASDRLKHDRQILSEERRHNGCR